IGKKLVERHDLLEEFLEIIGVDEENIYDDVEGIEHHLSWNSIDRMTDLITYFRVDESRIDDLKKIHEDSDMQPKLKDSNKLFVRIFIFLFYLSFLFMTFYFFLVFFNFIFSIFSIMLFYHNL